MKVSSSIAGSKGSFVEVLKKAPSRMEVIGCLEGRREARGVASKEVVQPGLHLNHAHKGDSWFSKGGSSGAREGFSLMSMQSA